MDKRSQWLQDLQLSKEMEKLARDNNTWEQRDHATNESLERWLDGLDCFTMLARRATNIKAHVMKDGVHWSRDALNWKNKSLAEGLATASSDDTGRRLQDAHWRIYRVPLRTAAAWRKRASKKNQDQQVEEVPDSDEELDSPRPLPETWKPLLPNSAHEEDIRERVSEL